jgi:SAM-dependent methyltransferase
MDLEEKTNSAYVNIAKEFSDKRQFNWDWIDNFVNSIDRGSNILDIGCGNGRNMKYDGYNFIGIDNCPQFINICQNDKLNVLNCDMTSIPIQDNTFNAIISIASFHHLATVDRRIAALKEMKRLLHAGGKILLSIWSVNQKQNPKLNFEYGDNDVPFKNKDGSILATRHYYIFKISEIRSLISREFQIENHTWDHGNEIFVLSHKN